MKYQSTNRTRLRFRNDQSPKQDPVLNVMCVSCYAKVTTLPRELSTEKVCRELPGRKKTLQNETGEVQGKTCVLRKRDAIENRLIEQRGNLIEIYECGRAYMSKLHRDEWLFNDANVSCFTLNHKAARFGQGELCSLLLSIPLKAPTNAISTRGGTNSVMIGGK